MKALTVLIAFIMSIAIGVSAAYAAADLYACENRGGQLFRLVNGPSDCGVGEVPVEFNLTSADYAVLVESNSYVAYSDNKSTVRCKAENADTGVPLAAERDLSIYGFQCRVGYSAWQVMTGPDFMGVTCSCCGGNETMSPEYIFIKCVLR